MERLQLLFHHRPPFPKQYFLTGGFFAKEIFLCIFKGARSVPSNHLPVALSSTFAEVLWDFPRRTIPRSSLPWIPSSNHRYGFGKSRDPLVTFSLISSGQPPSRTSREAISLTKISPYSFTLSLRSSSSLFLCDRVLRRCCCWWFKVGPLPGGLNSPKYFPLFTNDPQFISSPVFNRCSRAMATMHIKYAQLIRVLSGSSCICKERYRKYCPSVLPFSKVDSQASTINSPCFTSKFNSCALVASVFFLSTFLRSNRFTSSNPECETNDVASSVLPRFSFYRSIFNLYPSFCLQFLTPLLCLISVSRSAPKLYLPFYLSFYL